MPQSDYLAGDLAAARDAAGFVTVTDTLQVPGHDRVFVVGDVSDADAKMAGRAGMQAEVVADNSAPSSPAAASCAATSRCRRSSWCRSGPRAAPGSCRASTGSWAPTRPPTSRARTMLVDSYAALFGLTRGPRPHAPGA